ncbi:hypothetical protein AMJ57_04485 [Parcubacteria bacterium SG8_24]|nr:MAG: hypothetical protein AMJ57_04485 [Parcubacteria bacterium SG8_24]
MDIRLICVGRLKENHWSGAQKEYLKRLRPYLRLKVEEVEAEPISRTVPPEESKRRESERLSDRLTDDELIVVLDRRGDRLPSGDFARFLRQEGEPGRRLTFVVGGTTGLSDELLARSQKKISLSEMTFPHELARVILLEQLYRAMTILTGKRYHY